MKSTRCEILWSPARSEDQPTFVALTATELTMYRCSPKPGPDTHNPGLKLSDGLYAIPLHSSREFNCNNVTCMAWCPSLEFPNLLAIARIDNVKVVNFDSPGSSINLTTVLYMHNKDLPTCLALDWNPFETNMLVTAFGRGKTYIWNLDLRHAARGNNEPPHWEVQLDNGEFVQSAAWRYCQQTPSLIVGTTKDRLKVIHVKGVRDQQVLSFSYTKAVFNITPHHSNQELVLSATQDGAIHLWDLRNFAVCFAILNSDQRALSKLAWSPADNGNGLVAAALYKDMAHVRLFTVFHLYGQEAGAGSSGDTEPFVADRAVPLSQDLPGGQQAVSAFSWHGTKKNVLIALISRQHIVSTTFSDPSTLHILPDNTILCCSNRKIESMRLQHELGSPNSQLDPSVSMDLSDLFKYRLECDYGLELKSPWGKMSAEIIAHPLNQLAKPFWNWLNQRHHLAAIHNGMAPTSNSSDSTAKGAALDLRGVCSVFVGTPRGSAASAASATPLGRSRTSSLMMAKDEMTLKLESTDYTTKLYISQDRQDIVRLCGWPVVSVADNFAIVTFVHAIAVLPGQAARAAAIALYLLKLPLALEVLSQASNNSTGGNDDMLPIVALALPGVLAVESNMPTMYEVNLKKVTEPYLKLLLTFGRFASSADSLLYDDGLVLEDRVAIAAMYLPDERFHKFITSVSRQHLNHGRLTGLLFTGLESPDFLRLLQNYLNATGDIQTVALACAHSFANHRKPPAEIDAWTDQYRQLLNRFRLFRQRAAFDDFRRHLGVSVGKPRPTVSLGCSYCEKAVVQSVPLAGMQRVLPIYCQSCKRPLPRCAVCLARVGDDGWITWCQSCRHGGHAHHLMQWFVQYMYCPVVGCHCTCMQLDAPF